MERNILLVSFLLLWTLITPSPTHATETTHPVISQLQVAGTSATDEWIELYNPTGNTIDLSLYSLQYKSATGSTFQKKNFSSDAVIAAHGYFLISHTSAGVASSADMTHSTFSMSATGGNIYLVSTQTTLTSSTDPSIIDRLAYGTGNAPEGVSAPAPASSQSLERKPGDVLGNGTDTDTNSADFQLNTSPTPRSSQSQSQPPIDPPANDPLPTPDPASPLSAPTSTPPTTTLRLNEFLPRPSTTDKEWIEFVFSGNPFSLVGYTIEDGTGTILTLDAIPTGTFFVVELGSTKLNNDGDTVILKSPDGTIIDRVTYGSFDDGDTTNNAVAPTEGMTLNRFPDGTDSDSDVVDWFVSKQPTKGVTNIIIAPPASTTTITTTTPRGASASPSDPLPLVLINEFVSDPADGDIEWVELINAQQHPLHLDGWSLENSSGTIIQLSGLLGTADSNRYRVITTLKGGLRNDGDLLILWDSRRRQVDRVPYGDWNAQPSINAPVARDPYSVARIVDGYSSGNLIKDFVVTTTPTQGQRNVVTLPTHLPFPVPPNPSIAPSTLLTTQLKEGDLLINELFPNPLGEDHGHEWIELTTRSQAPITIPSLIIDVRNGARRTLASFTIDRSTPILLNNENLPPLPNAGATIRLLVEHYDDNNRVVEKELDRVTYATATNEGQSYGITPDGRWGWSTAPTPGVMNIRSAPNQPPIALFVAPAPAPQGTRVLFDASDSFDPEYQPLIFTWTFSDGSTSHGIAIQKELPALKKLTATLTVNDGLASSTVSDSISILLTSDQGTPPTTVSRMRTPAVALERVALTDIKNLERNTKILTQGVVSAPIGLLPEGAFALAGSGVIVKLSGRQQWPALTVGDVVQIAGVISVTQTGTAIRVNHADQITLLGHGNAPEPIHASISDALEREDNDLVTINGTVRDVRAKSWLVEDDENEIVALLPIGLERTATEGEGVTLTGIIEHTKTSNRLRLRFPDDIQFQQPPSTTTAITLPSHEPSKLPLFAFASVLALSVLALVAYPRSGKHTSSFEPLSETIIDQTGTLQIAGSFQSEKTTL